MTGDGFRDAVVCDDASPPGAAPADAARPGAAPPARLTREWLAELDLTTVSPAEFAALAARLTDDEVAALAADPVLRKRVLDEVFARMPSQLRAEAAVGLSALVRWEITGATTETYEVRVDAGRCVVRAGASDAEPRTTLTLGDLEFLRLTSGAANPFGLYVARRVRVAGDLALAAGMSRLFVVPSAD
ncbi:SCP2 sterol-binding domain-containing protein [Streptomyces lonarensis]|uniref:SCP2 sterol-binding domain-containing protein n=1 Tax=Streptomyces lonarensis TaxID=700599 RepID=A0A7X6D432_9ACTN|nr:SCP2 sterol-binding domain-containing protein [Streptomyces lonarensis]NJQ07824.1 SCP2 sterol-binding domain-containing protein [Streptomyces lonarensis]